MLGGGARAGPGVGGQDDPPQGGRARRRREGRRAGHGAGLPARRRPAGRAGFLYVDGHARVCYGKRQVQKTHVARLKFPAPATMETWVTDQDGDPVFMVVAEPSDSLAGELRRLPHQFAASPARGGGGRCVLTEAAGPRPCSRTSPRPGSACSPGARARPRTCLLKCLQPSRAPMIGAGPTTTSSPIPPSSWASARGRAKGQTVTLRQVTRLVPARGGGTRQIHALTSRTGLPAGAVCWRLSSRWREESYFRYARTRFALDCYAAAPDRMVPNPARKTTAARIRQAQAAAQAAETARTPLCSNCVALPRPGLLLEQPGDQRAGRPGRGRLARTGGSRQGSQCTFRLSCSSAAKARGTQPLSQR